MAIRQQRPRDAEFAVGKKRPTFNLFGHGPVKPRRRLHRKVAEDDDDRLFRFAMAAAAGLLGAYGLYWAYKNPAAVKQAVQYFGISPKAVAESGEVPAEPRSTKPPSEGTLGQDERIAALTEGDSSLSAFFAASIATTPGFGGEIPFRVGEGSTEDAVLEYVAQREYTMRFRMIHLFQTLAEKGDTQDDIMRKLRERAGLSDDFDFSAPTAEDLTKIGEAFPQTIRQADQYARRFLRDHFVVPAVARHLGLDVHSGPGAEALQEMMDGLALAHEASTRLDIPLMSPETATSAGENTAEVVVQALVGYAAEPEDSPRRAFLRGLLGEEGVVPLPDESRKAILAAMREGYLEKLQSALEAESNDDSLSHEQRMAAHEMSAVIGVTTALEQRLNNPEEALSRAEEWLTAVGSIGEDNLPEVARGIDATDLRVTIEALERPALGDNAAVRELRDTISHHGIDPSDPESVATWIRRADPAEINDLRQSALVASTQAMATAFHSREDAGAVIKASLDAQAQYRLQYRANHAISALPEMVDIPATILSKIPISGFSMLNYAYMGLGVAGEVAGVEQYADTPDSERGHHPFSYLADRQRRGLNAVRGRIREEQDLIDAGDYEGLRRLRESPVPGFESLNQAFWDRQHHLDRHDLAANVAGFFSARVSYPLISTRMSLQLGGVVQSVGLAIQAATDPDVRQAMLENPTQVLGEMASGMAQGIPLHVGMRFSERGAAGQALLEVSRNIVQGVQEGKGMWGKLRGGMAGATRPLNKSPGVARWSSMRKPFRNIADVANKAWGAPAAQGSGRLMAASSRARNILSFLGRGAAGMTASYAKFNVLLAGGVDAFWNLPRAALGTEGAVSDVERNAYLGTIAMDGDVPSRGGALAIIRELAWLPLKGLTAQQRAQMTSAATMGYNYMTQGRSGLRTGSQHDVTPDDSPAYRGHLRAMQDLQVAAVQETLEPHIQNLMAHHPLFSQLPTATATLAREVITMAFTQRLLPRWEEQEVILPGDLTTTRRQASHRLQSFEPSTRLLSDPSGISFLEESERFIREVLIPDEYLADHVIGRAALTVLGQTTGLSQDKVLDHLNAPDGNQWASEAVSQWVEQHGIAGIAKLPAFTSAAHQHSQIYGGTLRRVDALIESSPHLQWLSDERKQAIRDAAMDHAASELTSDIEQWKSWGATPTDVIEGREIDTPDGQTVHVGANQWATQYFNSGPLAGVPTEPFDPRTSDIRDEHDLRWRLAALVGPAADELLDPETINSEIDTNSKATSQEREQPYRTTLDEEQWAEFMRGRGIDARQAPTTTAMEQARAQMHPPGWRDESNEDYLARRRREIEESRGDLLWGLMQGDTPTLGDIDAAERAGTLNPRAARRLREQHHPDGPQQAELAPLESDATAPAADHVIKQYYAITAALAKAGGLPVRLGSGFNRGPVREQQTPAFYDIAANPETGEAELVGRLRPASVYSDEGGHAALTSRLHALARTDPVGFSRGFGVPLDDVLLAADIPHLQQRMRPPAEEGEGYVTYDPESGERRVVPTWREAQDAITAAHGRPEALQRYAGYFSPQRMQYQQQLRDWRRDYDTHQQEMQDYTPRRGPMGVTRPRPPAPQAPLWLTQGDQASTTQIPTQNGGGGGAGPSPLMGDS